MHDSSISAHAISQQIGEMSATLSEWSDSVRNGLFSVLDELGLARTSGAYSMGSDENMLSSTSRSNVKKGDDLSDSAILAGSDEPSRWTVVKIDEENKVIYPSVKVNFIVDSLSPDEGVRLKDLAHRGFERFWSRKINLNGEQYDIKSYLIEDEGGLDMKFEYSNAKKSREI